ncbi:MAG: CopG family ribbon-helix-helix protein [Desulfovermiculus sp.]
MQMTIRLPDEYKTRIDDIALRTGLKRSEVARLAIKQFIERLDSQSTEERPASKAQDLLGVTESGVSDLGTGHRRHLLKRMRERNR